MRLKHLELPLAFILEMVEQTWLDLKFEARVDDGYRLVR